MKIWKAIEKYVSSIINEFFKTDEDVKGDKELRSWAEDIHTNNFPGYYGAKNGYNFPNSIIIELESAHRALAAL